MTSKKLALFDLDHTLLPLDSDYQWAVFMAETGRAGDPAQALRRNQELMDRYNAGDLTAEQAAEFMLGLLAAHPPHMLAAWHEEFMQQIIRPAMTATNSFVTSPIARAFGIPTLIATEPEYKAGRYTGKIAGIPSFKHGKVIRVQRWLASLGKTLQDFETSHFYSDSSNDLPLLEVVTHPIATNPSPGLLAVAQERTWPVLNLFTQLSDKKS
jgi:HAD superfamily phosphoserine phosphatase-like hydrolase